MNNVEYTILSQSKMIVKTKVENIVLGNIIVIPEQYTEKGTNGKVIGIKPVIPSMKGLNNFQDYHYIPSVRFEVLLANRTSFFMILTKDSKIEVII